MIQNETEMIPVGYMAMRIVCRPDWLNAPNVTDIYSVGGCSSEYFDNDYIESWKHNGYWLFDSPEVIRSLAQEKSIDLQHSRLFYYEAYELEFASEVWRSFSPEPSMPTNILPPIGKRLEGFDVVTFWAGNKPEHSPLSCNSLAENIHTNAHCLFEMFGEAEANLNAGQFENCEPGPYRIFAVYSVDWP